MSSPVVQYGKGFLTEMDDIDDPIIPLQETTQYGLQGFAYDESATSLGVFYRSSSPLKSWRRILKQWPEIELGAVGDEEFTFSYAPKSHRDGVDFLQAMGASRADQRESQ